MWHPVMHAPIMVVDSSEQKVSIFDLTNSNFEFFHMETELVVFLSQMNQKSSV